MLDCGLLHIGGGAHSHASDVLNPVTTEGDFWIAKASQALQLKP
jgi:hypothetical protein